MAKKQAITRSSGGTVTVCCKLPHGFALRVFDFEDGEEPVQGGGVKKTKLAVQKGEVVMLKGNSAPFGEAPRAEVAGGYALTPNVPADFFALWLEQNKDADVVKNRLIFASEASQARDEAKDNKTTRSGLERIDVRKNSKDPRMMRGIKTADEAKEVEEA